jgi:thymidylate synthase
MQEYDSFTDCFYNLTKLIYENYEYEVSPRNMKVRESLGVSFQINNPRNRLLFIPERKTSLTYTIAEALWYFTGNNETKWISNYSSFWDNISDDGKTANSAYGARIFKCHKSIVNGLLNQWDYVKNELLSDNDSRRAVIHIRVPDDSKYAKLDVPCTLTLQFFIRNNKLHMITNMRSSDLILGITYDIPAFTLFQEKLANELNVELGAYRHMSNSLHIYERHFKMCEKILNSSNSSFETFEMQKMPVVGDKTFEDLHLLQDVFRQTDDINRITKILNSYESNEYWEDWAKILAAHRIGKLGYKKLKKDLIKTTNFIGYHQFGT